MIATEIQDARRTSVVGREARLELVFGVRAGRTELVHAYAEPPFRAGRAFHEGDGLHMIMASSAPGLFGGDRLRQIVRVEAGARVRLTSQSAMQVHPTVDAAVAEIAFDCTVEDGASLVCEWDPQIPFAGARLRQRITVSVAASGRLFWSDAFTAGRHASGERWQFDVLDHELRLSRNGSLDYLERYRIEPAERRATLKWTGGDAAVFGTILCASPSGVVNAVPDSVMDAVREDLAGVDGCRTAVDRTAGSLVVVRLMARSSVSFHQARALAACRLRYRL